MAQPRALPLFAVVTFLLGIPYLLIAVALDGFDAAFVAWARVALAAIVLIVVIGVGPLAASLRRRPLAICGFSVVQFTIPMLLIAESERTVPSSLVGCLIATEPLWIALLARRMSGGERTGTMETVGILVGLVGVGVLLGVDFGGGLAGAALALGAAATYALATLVIPRLTVDVPVMHLVAIGLAISALTLLPLVLGSPPDDVPDVLPVAALIGLAVAGTALAFPLWFALVVRVGPSRAALVTYTSPVVAVVLGILLLGEEPGRLTPLGLALILGGSWLASAAASRRRVPEVSAALGCVAPCPDADGIGPPLTRTAES
jgi:drug/metabolite transporter (DMT)-like permease